MIKKLLTGIFYIFFSTSAFSQFFTTDVIVQGSMQIGTDATNGYSFGSDTFVMSENNLRMLFDDTSASAYFPNNDWRFTFNDQTNGGGNYFSIDDVTGGTVPFRIDAKAPNNSFRIADNGNVGIGTNNPGSIELNIADDDTPTVRFAQSGGGFGNQSWDIAGNEANFFIRDVTNGSKLPFKIQPKAPTNTLAIGQNGNIGVGFGGNVFPGINANASIHMASTTKGLLINRMTTGQRATFAGNLDASLNGMMIYDTDENKLYLWNGTEWVTDTDSQDLNLSGDILSLTNDATTVDLSGYLDNTDNQELSLTTNTLSISGGAVSVDLSKYLDNTDAQDLDISGNILSLTNDGTTVDLSGYLDNTDAQTLSFDNGNLSIAGGNSIDLSALQDGTGTDSQTLDLTANVLSITNGNTVDLSAFVNTDTQNLTSANLNGTNLTIEIENGTSVTVDLAPIVSSLESDLANAQDEIFVLQTQMTEILSRLDALEQSVVGQDNPLEKGNRPILYQNIPNPFNGTSTIKYYLPEGINNASIVFSDVTGKVFSTVSLKETGDGELNVNSDGLARGTYFYTLYVGSRKFETKKMVIE